MSTVISFKKDSIFFIKTLVFLLQYFLYTSTAFSADDMNIQPEIPKKSLAKDHSSTVKKKNSERNIGIFKISEVKKEKINDIKSGNYFMYISKAIQKGKEKNYVDLSKKIIYSYPLFTNEEDLFNFLMTQKKEYSSFVIFFLRQLVLEGLPNGLDNFRAAKASFINLKDGLIDDPIFTFLLKSFTDFHFFDLNALPKSLLTTSNEKWFETWPIERFVHALTQRDMNMYCAVSFKDLRANLEHPSIPPNSILTITNQFDRTVNWICFEILKRNESREKTKFIQLFRIIGRMLYNNKNYHGAMQVALAFSKMQISRILTPREKEEINSEEFVKDLTPKNNYRNYRSLIHHPNSKSPELLLLPVLFKDMLVAHEMKAVDEIAYMMEIFYRTQTFLNSFIPSNGNDMEALKFVTHFPDIHDSTLDEMSSLIKQWNFPRDKNLPPNLEDWTMSHFYTFLEKYDGDPSVCNIFSKGIYSGKDLSIYLNNCNSLEEIDKYLTHMGFTPHINKGLFDYIKRAPSAFIDLPALNTSISNAIILDTKRKSLINLEKDQRELDAISQEEKFKQ